MKTLRDKITKFVSIDGTEYITIPFDAGDLNPFQISFICYVWEKRECFVDKNKKRKIWKYNTDNPYIDDIEELVSLGFIKISEKNKYGLVKYSVSNNLSGYTIHKYKSDFWTILKRKI